MENQENRQNAPQQQEEQLTDLEKLTQSICGKGVTFYASDTCANCDHYSGYGMPLCDTCEKLPGWNVVS